TRTDSIEVDCGRMPHSWIGENRHNGRTTWEFHAFDGQPHATQLFCVQSLDKTLVPIDAQLGFNILPVCRPADLEAPTRSPVRHLDMFPTVFLFFGYGNLCQRHGYRWLYLGRDSGHHRMRRSTMNGHTVESEDTQEYS